MGTDFRPYMYIVGVAIGVAVVAVVGVAVTLLCMQYICLRVSLNRELRQNDRQKGIISAPKSTVVVSAVCHA